MLEQQESTEPRVPALGINPWIRRLLILFFALILAFVVWRYWCYVQNPRDAASPSELGLPALFVFAGVAILFLMVPWEKLGLRIKKIGALEFEQVVETQAAEHAEELSEIEDRLTSLENAVRGVHEGIQLGEVYEEPELRKLLLEFLTKHASWAFSPARIRAWGSQQPGFEKLKDYDPAFLRSTLRKFVAEGVLETRISRKGNTLYRLAE